MKKSARKAQIKRIRALSKKWVRILGLLWWSRIEFLYFEERESFVHTESAPTVHEDGCESVMRTRAMWEYLWAEVEVNLQMVAELSDKDLERAFLHEMAHIMVCEMREEGLHHEERVCSRLAQAFRWIADLS